MEPTEKSRNIAFQTRSSRRQFIKSAALAPFGIAFATSRMNLSTAQGSPSSESHLPFLTPDNFEDLNVFAWRVEQGRFDAANPLVEPVMAWDAGSVFESGTVIRDPLDGLWKSWQISSPPSLTPKPEGTTIYPYDARL